MEEWITPGNEGDDAAVYAPILTLTPTDALVEPATLVSEPLFFLILLKLSLILAHTNLHSPAENEAPRVLTGTPDIVTTSLEMELT